MNGKAPPALKIGVMGGTVAAGCAADSGTSGGGADGADGGGCGCGCAASTTKLGTLAPTLAKGLKA
jgi:hypothetical protein